MFLLFVYLWQSLRLFCCSKLSDFISAYAFLWKWYSGFRGCFSWCYSASLSLSRPAPCSNTHLPCLFIPSPSCCWAPVELFKPGFPYCSSPLKGLQNQWFDLFEVGKKYWECLNNIPINRLGVKCTVNGYLFVCVMTHQKKTLWQEQILCFLASIDWMINWSKHWESQFTHLKGLWEIRKEMLTFSIIFYIYVFFFVLFLFLLNSNILKLHKSGVKVWIWRSCCTSELPSWFVNMNVNVCLGRVVHSYTVGWSCPGHGVWNHHAFCSS